MPERRSIEREFDKIRRTYSVTASDVAKSFLAEALALKTTADVTTVDDIAAALR